jgi:hypothetical protein
VGGAVVGGIGLSKRVITCCDIWALEVRLAFVDREARRRLGGAVYRADAVEIVKMLTPDVARELPQIAEPAALIALARHTPGADELALGIIGRLTERDWDGDNELGVELRHALGQEPVAPLPAIPVDLDQLVDLLQGGEHHSGGRVNVRTGEALPQLMFVETADQFDQDEDAIEDKWLYVDALGSQEAYRDMERFIADGFRRSLPAR